MTSVARGELPAARGELLGRASFKRWIDHGQNLRRLTVSAKHHLVAPALGRSGLPQVLPRWMLGTLAEPLREWLGD